MPKYEYACTGCGDQSEVVQKFTDDPLTVCQRCGGRLRKVFSPVGIVFKGNGFYRTDSRAPAKEPVAAGQSANGSEPAAKATGDGKSGAAEAGAKGSGPSHGNGSRTGSSSSSTSPVGGGSPAGSSGGSSSTKVA